MVEAFGYELGPMMNKRTQRRYLGVQSSKNATENIRKKVSKALRAADRAPL